MKTMKPIYALAAAVGVRVRDLPLTAEAVVAALERD